MRREAGNEKAPPRRARELSELADESRRRTKSGGEALFDEGLQFRRGLHFNEATREFDAVLDDEHRRDVLHVKLFLELGRGFGVDRDELHAAGVFLREGLVEGRGAAAVDAPGGADGENHGDVGLVDDFVDIGGGDGDDFAHGENLLRSVKGTGGALFLPVR